MPNVHLISRRDEIVQDLTKLFWSSDFLVSFDTFDTFAGRKSEMLSNFLECNLTS